MTQECLILGFSLSFLTLSHIFASSTHITIIFTYLEMPSSPLSSHVLSILLCYLASMSATCVWHCWYGGLWTLQCSSSHQHHHSQQHTVDTTKAGSFDHGKQSHIVIALLAVWGSFFAPFSSFDVTCNHATTCYKINTSLKKMQGIHNRWVLYCNKMYYSLLLL